MGLPWSSIWTSAPVFAAFLIGLAFERAAVLWLLMGVGAVISMWLNTRYVSLVES